MTSPTSLNLRAAITPSTDKPSRERIDHANLDRRRRRGVHPRSEDGLDEVRSDVRSDDVAARAKVPAAGGRRDAPSSERPR